MANGRDFTMGRVGSGDRSGQATPHNDELGGVPEELVRALDESLDDLEHDRTSDMGEFLDRMQAKIDAAIAADRKTAGR